MLSAIGSPTAPALPRQGSAQLSTSMEGLGLPHAPKQLQGGSASGVPLSLSGAPLPKRNSLPPLRVMPSMLGGGADALGSPTGAAAAAQATGASGMHASLSGSSLAPLDAASRAGSCGGLSALVPGETAAGGAQASVLSPTEGLGLLGQPNGRIRQSFGHGQGQAAVSTGADSTAFEHLETVCKAQVELYRWVVWFELQGVHSERLNMSSCTTASCGTACKALAAS